MLNKLKQENIFNYFCQISDIARPSKNMSGIAQFCTDFAKKQGLEYYKDEFNNVIIKKNAYKGYEDKPTIILQGHLDMVCEKDKGVSIDFNKNGITLDVKDDFLFAKGTSLGADNGIAIAYILSILADKSLKHPKIEALFTTDEEIGMCGAIGLDAKHLNGKILINIDMEEEGVLTVGCAGGARADVTIPVNFITKDGNFFEIKVDGLIGGHSGVEIDKGRLNANILLGKIINSLKTYGVNIASINGGSKDNAITRSASAIVCSNFNLQELDGLINKEFKTKAEPGLNITINSLDKSQKVLDDISTNNVINFLVTTKNGVIEYSNDIKGLVETSLNLGILKTNNKNVSFSFAVRSSKEAKLQELLKTLKAIAKDNGGTINTHSFYPAWEYNKESKIREIFKTEYFKMYNEYPQITVIHAGLECGILTQKISNLDAISFGPTMYSVHTTQEKLSISSARRTYKYLLSVLENL